MYGKITDEVFCKCMDYLDSPYSLNDNSGKGGRVKNEKAVLEFEDRNLFFNYFNHVSVFHRIYSLLPKIEASKLV